MYLINAFFTPTDPTTRCYSDMYGYGRGLEFRRIVALGLVLAISYHCQSAEASGENNYHPRDSALVKTTRDASAKQNKRFGWLKVKPLWMDIEKSCFARTCIAPYAVQLISIEPTINHTAMFDMDIDVPMPPVDMYFPTPPSKPRPLRKTAEVTPSEPETASTTANFSVGLFGVDPTYRFPRHCHSMIENSATFHLTLGGGSGKNSRLPIPPPPSIISFGADCLNLTFQIFVIPAMPDSILADGQNEPGSESVDNLNLLGTAASSDTALNVRTPVPMWIVAILAGVNAALLFGIIALVWHVALSARKKRNKRLRRQRSSAASSGTTTNSYVPSCTTPMNRRMTPPLPPPPMRPPPRTVIDPDQQEPKYDVPWTDGKFEKSNGDNEHYKITFNTLQHKQRDPQFFNYYFSADDRKHSVQSPVLAGDEINSNDRPKPHRRTTTPATGTLR